MRGLRGPVPRDTPGLDYKVGSRENAGAARRAAPVVLSLVAAAAVMLSGCAKAGAEKQNTDAHPGDRPPGAGAPQYPQPGATSGNATPGSSESNKTPTPSGVASSSSTTKRPSSAATTPPGAGGQGGGNTGNTAMPEECDAQFLEINTPGKKRQLRVTVTAKGVPSGKSFYSGHTVENPNDMAKVWPGNEFTIPYPSEPIAIVAVGGVALGKNPDGSYRVDIAQQVAWCEPFNP